VKDTTMSRPPETVSTGPAQVEAAWLRFKNGPGGALLHESLRLRGSYLDSISLPRLPPEVLLPGAIPWNLLAMREADARGDPIGDRLSREGTILANSVACWAAYRESKTVYAVEPLLADALARTAWPDAVPTEALRLPSRCPVLSLPWQGEPVHVAAHYDLLTMAEASGRLELRLSGLQGDQWVMFSVLHLVGEDFAACARDAAIVTAELQESRTIPGEDRIPDAELYPLVHNDLAGLVLTVLLYLAGEPDLVRQVHPGAKPTRDARMQRREPERWKDLRAPSLFAVGTTYRAAVERWEEERQREEGEATGRTIRPHVRRAHAHLYWTGTGRQIPRIRFLLPIPVKGAAVREEASRTTESTVR
jgi:hypothetical protein